MKNIIALLIVALVAVAGYLYMNQERTAGERLGDSLDALNDGNLGEAVDEMGNETKGDKVIDEMKDAVAPAE